MESASSEERERLQLIADEIIRMAEEDQRGIKDKHTEAEPIFQRNTERMKAIVAEIGWPAIPKVGSRASYMAWLVIQHADHDVEFQRRCLLEMRSLPEGDIRKENIAYLEDRVRVHEGRPQLYGTQFYRDENGVFGPRPIEDGENLERRREEMEMIPFSEYERSMLSPDQG